MPLGRLALLAAASLVAACGVAQASKVLDSRSTERLAGGTGNASPAVGASALIKGSYCSKLSAAG